MLLVKVKSVRYKDYNYLQRRGIESTNGYCRQTTGSLFTFRYQERKDGREDRLSQTQSDIMHKNTRLSTGNTSSHSILYGNARCLLFKIASLVSRVFNKKFNR
ncbi:MAG: hypothetical protein JST81_06660 [Bacteroidetes bacterium]|nr:hypothetical protein [Bacteroidota bacterium]